jgi:pyruvate,water dikinase
LSSPLALDLALVDADALDLAGGKAANLGELIRAGLPVPPGVCVATDAYRHVARAAGLCPGGSSLRPTCSRLKALTPS